MEDKITAMLLRAESKAESGNKQPLRSQGEEAMCAGHRGAGSGRVSALVYGGLR